MTAIEDAADSLWRDLSRRDRRQLSVGVGAGKLVVYYDETAGPWLKPLPTEWSGWPVEHRPTGGAIIIGG